MLFRVCLVSKEVHLILDDIEQDYEGSDYKFYHVDVEDESNQF